MLALHPGHLLLTVTRDTSWMDFGCDPFQLPMAARTSPHPCVRSSGWGWDFFYVPEHRGLQISFLSIPPFFLPFVSPSLSSPLAAPLPPSDRASPPPPSLRRSRGGEQGCRNSQAQVRGARCALPPGTAPTAAADSPLEIMCCGRERLNRPRRSAGAGTARQPGAATPGSRLRRA